MTASIGRKRARMDENIRFDPALDGKSDCADVSAIRRGSRPRLTRACILVGAIVCGFAAPATARAADPFGTTQIVQGVESAVAEATAAVPQASEASVGVAGDPTRALESATKTLEVATKQAAAVASSAAAAAQRESQSARVASVPAGSGEAKVTRAPARTHRRAARRHVRPAGRSPRKALIVRPTLFTSTESNVVRPQPTSPAAVSVDRAASGSARGSRATPKPTARPTPQRLPPSPLPPQPGATMSGQGGVQGPLTPLVFGALGAVLLLIAFQFLPRALPPRAFRKPRQIALPPWHPG
jgi:hypothetical protein